MTDRPAIQTTDALVLGNLQIALGLLYHARSSIRLPEVFPEAEVARHWLLVTGIYSLLEQSLKSLRRLEDPAYDNTAMHADSHDLSTVYSGLAEESKQALRQYFAEYASLEGFDDLAGLDEYLAEKGSRDRYARWRYFLMDNSLEALDAGQKGPFHTDLMIEVIHGATDLISAKLYPRPDEAPDEAPDINSVSRRLQRDIRPAPYGVSEAEAEQATAEVMAWLRANPWRLDAYSRWLRAGELDHYPSEFMRGWVGETMSRAANTGTDRSSALTTHRDLGAAYDMGRFKARAKRSCLTWDGKRFVSRNPLPAPVTDLWLQGEWSIEWAAQGTRWTGELDRAVTQMPTRPGQTIRVSVKDALRDENGDPMGEHELSAMPVGMLTVKMDGHTAETMPAAIYLRSGGDNPEDNDPPFRYSILFVRTDDNGDYENIQLTDFRCPGCRGTGFCPECLGENEGECSCESGLCAECEGYGEDGQHLLAPLAKLRQDHYKRKREAAKAVQPDEKPVPPPKVGLSPQQRWTRGNAISHMERAALAAAAASTSDIANPESAEPVGHLGTRDKDLFRVLLDRMRSAALVLPPAAAGVGSPRIIDSALAHLLQDIIRGVVALPHRDRAKNAHRPVGKLESEARTRLSVSGTTLPRDPLVEFARQVATDIAQHVDKLLAILERPKS